MFDLTNDLCSHKREWPDNWAYFYYALSTRHQYMPDNTMLYIHGKAEKLAGHDIPYLLGVPKNGVGKESCRLLLPREPEPIHCYCIMWINKKQGEWRRGKRYGYIVLKEDEKAINQAVELYAANHYV